MECPECKGRGDAIYIKDETCGQHNGPITVEYVDECESCEGTGVVCDRCGGPGNPEIIEVVGYCSECDGH